MALRIALADDAKILRDGLRRAFESVGEIVVGEAGNGADAVRLVEEHAPDVIVMDLSMPILGGAAATRRIVELDLDTKVVILTQLDDIDQTQQALQAGAVGLLSKDSSFTDVHKTVLAAAEGLTSLSPELASSVLSMNETAPADDEPLLSSRQVEILQLIADGHTTKQAARELGIAQKTVHNHLNGVYRRLDTQNLTHAVLSAVRLGIIDLN